MTYSSHFADTCDSHPDMDLYIVRPVCLRPRLSAATIAPSLATHHHLAMMLASCCACLTSVLPPIQSHSCILSPSWGMYDSVSVLAYLSVEGVCHIGAVKPAADVFAC